VKRDGRREPYDRQRSLRHPEGVRKRPVSADTIEHLVETSAEFQSGAEKEISTIRIGERVMSKLLQVDDVAYVRFASVYRQFKDVSQFVEEIKSSSPSPRDQRSHDTVRSFPASVHATALRLAERGRADRAQRRSARWSCGEDASSGRVPPRRGLPTPRSRLRRRDAAAMGRTCM